MLCPILSIRPQAIIRKAHWALVAFGLSLASFCQAAVSPERVVVVANSADPVSQQIAQYYMQQRGIPEKNLIELETTTSQKISWDAFIQTVFNPLRRELIEQDWITGSVSDHPDANGRLQAALISNHIDFLVLCRLPANIARDNSRLAYEDKLPSKKEFQTTAASVDSELSLLMSNNPPLVGFVANPLFAQRSMPSAVAESVVRVARLDGPDFAAVKGSLDSALEAEKHGLRGRGYIDMGGPHADGDRWIEQAGQFIERMGYPVSWDKERALMGWRDRVDAAAFYFGWWTTSASGVFADPDFRFPPGAIAFHIFSYSAADMRSRTHNWVGPLIDRGAAVTVGNVYEPYLQLTHRPNLFMEGMTQGMTAGEAAYYSLPVLSWMTVFVGDPLYQPFKVDLDTQLQQGEDAPDALTQYAVLRKMKLMRADKQYEDAFIYGVEQQRRLQGLALALSLARQYEMRGGHTKAMEQLEPWLDSPGLPVSDWSLYFEVGQFYESVNEDDAALRVYKNLLSLSDDTPAALTTYYASAIELAHKMGNTSQAESWQETLTRMQVNEQEKRVRQKIQEHQQ